MDEVPVPRTQQLCQALAAGLGLDGASAAMVTDSGERDLVYATDPVISHLDELEFTLAEGHCLDAVHTRGPVFAANLGDETARTR